MSFAFQHMVDHGCVLMFTFLPAFWLSAGASTDPCFVATWTVPTRRTLPVHPCTLLDVLDIYDLHQELWKGRSWHEQDREWYVRTSLCCIGWCFYMSFVLYMSESYLLWISVGQKLPYLMEMRYNLPMATKSHSDWYSTCLFACKYLSGTEDELFSKSFQQRRHLFKCFLSITDPQQIAI